MSMFSTTTSQPPASAMLMRILLLVPFILSFATASLGHVTTLQPDKTTLQSSLDPAFIPAGGTNTILSQVQHAAGDGIRTIDVAGAGLAQQMWNKQLSTTIKLPDTTGTFGSDKQRKREDAPDTETWWQQHQLRITVIFGILFISTLLLLVGSFALLRKFRQKSYLLEQSLDSITGLVSDLEQQRRQANLYLEISKAMIVGLDREGLITVVNEAACSLLGYSHDELVGCDWFDTCIPEEIREDLRRMYLTIIDTKDLDTKFANFDNQVLTRQGTRITISWHNTLVKNDSGLNIGTISSGIDITQRVEALRGLSESYEQFRTLYNQFESLLHGISEPLLFLGHDLKLLWANDAATENWLFRNAVQQGQVCNSTIMCQQHCEDGCLIRKCFRDNQEQSQNFYHSSGRSLNVRVFPAINDNSNPQSVIILAHDITETLKIRTEMTRAAQLASVGELAANVAHEINNPLHGIINYAEILKTKTDDPDFTHDLLSRIANEGERISLIVKNLLSYTRSNNEKPGPAALSMITQSVDLLLGNKLKSKNILVEQDIPDDLPLIRTNGNQMQQVFINLYGNAHDALLEKKFAESEQKRILVRARVVEDMVEICCEDNGTGMPESILSRVFESFYTTKPVGKGTGLGLSISRSIVEEQGGEMHIESTAGKGTRISFTIPIFKQSDILQPKVTN